ncbi:FAD-binding oxidoreductase [Shewanella salipaludis]|uniref:FAD-binding oxidoreductase n=1 Tax=Shewanella salipaludis TaxID=2723052 RepID=A0A972JME5_9GAMM|nr:FAD-binding oxidoreductase [Shewanella salipaludis]NMH67179.1 FAD-binding oxidoreductase [Shewanella salipaludis]
MEKFQIYTLDDKPKKLDKTELDALRQGIRGQVILPGEDDYHQVRKIWNAMFDRHPAVIVRCRGTADVIQAVRFARQHKLLTSVRGAGHNIAGKSLFDGAMLIDLSLMTAVQVDPDALEVTAGAGATLGDVDHETQAYGLAVPMGINSTTGIAGLSLGGGFGWLSRSLGLTADNLLAAEVVTAAGERLSCSAHHYADLFWAIRGGGGNFGIVTSFKFKLHPVGPEVMSGAIVYPFDQAKFVLQAYRQFCQNCPDALSVWAVFRDAPPLPFLPKAAHGTKVLILAALYNGDLKEGDKWLAQLRKFGTPIADGFAPHPFGAFQQAFDPLLTPGARNYWKSHNFASLDDGLIDSLVDYAARLPSPQSEIFLAQMGGATNRVAADACAYPHRDVEFIMNVHTRWDDTEQDDVCIEWAREFYQATKPFATGGVYVNFISEDEDRVQGAYGSNLARLATVKAKYDPDNFFRLNQNITPQ